MRLLAVVSAGFVVVAFAAAGRAGAQGFTDVTQESGVAAIRATRPSGWWMSGMQFVDLDADGDLDLFLGTHSPGVGVGIASTNDGSGHFTAIPGGLPWTIELHSLYDLNEDGKVDIVVTEGDGGGRWWFNTSTAGGVGFQQTVLSDIQSRFQSMIDINRDGRVDWLTVGGGQGQPEIRTYLGDGRGGLTQTKPLLLGGQATPIPFDIDGDGDIDIIMRSGVYGGVEDTRVYRNDGSMNFAEVTKEVGLDATGLVVLGQGDYDNDGDTDLVVLENRKFPLAIYLNDRGVFTKKPNAVSGPTGGSGNMGVVGMGALVDLDNDGFGDLVVAGSLYVHVLKGMAGGAFQYANQAWGISTGQPVLPDTGYCFGDVDGDGDIDLMVYKQSSDKEPALYRNDFPKRNWVKVRPVGAPGNKGAMGAKVRIYAAGTQQLLAYEEVYARAQQVLANYYAFGETERHFGLGSQNAVDVTVLFYPSNKLVRKDGVAANTTVRISETDGSAVVVPAPVPTDASSPSVSRDAGAGSGSGGAGGVTGAPSAGGAGDSSAPAPSDARLSEANEAGETTTGCTCRVGLGRAPGFPLLTGVIGWMWLRRSRAARRSSR